MKVHLLSAAVIAVALGATGCSSAKKDSGPPAQSLPGGTAGSRDGAFVYAVDGATDAVTVVNRRSKKKIADVRVGSAPESITVAPDDTVFVANRGSRSVSVIHPGDWREAERIPAGLEPLGVAVSPDNRTLYILNGSSIESPDAGTLMAVDLPTRVLRWEVTLSDEPKELQAVDADRVRVALRNSNASVDVDVAKGLARPRP